MSELARLRKERRELKEKLSNTNDYEEQRKLKSKIWINGSYITQQKRLFSYDKHELVDVINNLHKVILSKEKDISFFIDEIEDAVDSIETISPNEGKKVLLRALDDYDRRN